MNNQTITKIFTYDKLTERKSGALTMMIFSFALLLSPLIFMSIVGIGLSLGSSLFAPHLPIADGYVTSQLTLLGWADLCIFIVAFPLFFTYTATGLNQLLCCYVIMDGKFIRLKWSARRDRIRSTSLHLTAGSIAKVTNKNRGDLYQTARGILAYLEGIDMMSKPEIAAEHLSGVGEKYPITLIEFDNIVFVKSSKKKLVFLADITKKDKVKRKKFTIYTMYCDMSQLENLCRGGVLLVDN